MSLFQKLYEYNIEGHQNQNNRWRSLIVFLLSSKNKQTRMNQELKGFCWILVKNANSYLTITFQLVS